ncbi:MAG: DUF2239 family protein [Acidobacteriota bacterium]
MESCRTYTSFIGTTLVASGPLDQVLPELKSWSDRDQGAVIATFDDETGLQVDFDLRGTIPELLARALPAPVRTGPGRPKLGVIPREVSLLPRHWEWLQQQPNGASAAIRRLVDEARKKVPDDEKTRLAIEATSRVLSGIAGDLPGYQEATRALFARDGEQFNNLIREWPQDIREYVQRLSPGPFGTAGEKRPSRMNYT